MMSSGRERVCEPPKGTPAMKLFDEASEGPHHRGKCHYALCCMAGRRSSLSRPNSAAKMAFAFLTPWWRQVIDDPVPDSRDLSDKRSPN